MTPGKKAIPVEIRAAMLTMQGYDATDDICPECEERLYVYHDRHLSFAVDFDMRVEIIDHRECCPNCGWSQLKSTLKGI